MGIGETEAEMHGGRRESRRRHRWGGLPKARGLKPPLTRTSERKHRELNDELKNAKECIIKVKLAGGKGEDVQLIQIFPFAVMSST